MQCFKNFRFITQSLILIFIPGAMVFAQIQKTKTVFLDSVFNPVAEKIRASYFRNYFSTYHESEPDSAEDRYVTGELYTNGRIGSRNKKDVYIGFTQGYFKNGGVRFVKDDRNGTYQSFYPDGKMEVNAATSEGLFNGKYTSYKPDGEIGYFRYYESGRQICEAGSNTGVGSYFEYTMQVGYNSPKPNLGKRSGFYLNDEKNYLGNRADSCVTVWFTDSLPFTDSMRIHVDLHSIQKRRTDTMALFFQMVKAIPTFIFI